MKIGFDLDGVLAQFNFPYARLLAEENGSCLLPEGYKHDPNWPPVWNWDTHYGYSSEVQARVWRNRIIPSDRFWRQLQPMVGAKEVAKCLNKLSRYGTEISFLTNRMGHNAKWQTEMWLYDLGIDFPTVLLASDKVPIIRSLGLDYYIDDKLETMLELVRVSEREKWLVSDKWFLKSAPYNVDGRIPGMRVVNSAKDALVEAGLL